MGTSRIQVAWLALLVVASGLSYIGAEHVFDLHMHHIGTVFALAALVWTMRTTPLSDVAFSAVSFFVFMHIFGAHWLYSHVPYDTWAKGWFGTSINETFGWQRNHYDRLIHLSFGLLVTGAFRELVRARTNSSPTAVRFFAVTIILAGSALYEIVEWGIAILADPTSAENYNGQQGDVFDPQKDSALAAIGAFVSTGWDALLRRRPS